ncbi:hypothetical protein [Algoriphagus litoralis]|uniref:hypothetical protein n=1 Tax=Algoriphagus litoralis TaxID=2202829 RepID=UPI00130040BE|nr:hypothetical protein [Algoriphagus litoralis]
MLKVHSKLFRPTKWGIFQFSDYPQSCCNYQILYRFTSTWFDQLINRRSVSLSFVFDGGDENAAARIFHPHPLMTSNPLAERPPPGGQEVEVKIKKIRLLGELRIFI